jgi:hypothetical protein
MRDGKFSYPTPKRLLVSQWLYVAKRRCAHNGLSRSGACPYPEVTCGIRIRQRHRVQRIRRDAESEIGAAVALHQNASRERSSRTASRRGRRNYFCARRRASCQYPNRRHCQPSPRRGRIVCQLSKPSESRRDLNSIRCSCFQAAARIAVSIAEIE